MAFSDDIAKVSEQVRKHAEQVSGEEAAKMGLIMPFFSALGYDVFDPTEMIPEFIADFAIKKAGQFEKVDYAIAINGAIVMIVEAKARDKQPNAHDGQLKRYFNGLLTTGVAIGTNGIEYRLPVNEVRALASGFEVQEMSASMGDATSRVVISSVNDLDNLSDLILTCYEAESAKHFSQKVAHVGV